MRRKGGETRRLATLRLASIVSKLDLVEAGLADRTQYEVSERARIPVADVLAAYRKFLEGRGRSAAHVSKAIAYCSAILRDGVFRYDGLGEKRTRVKVVEPIGAAALADIRETDVERFLADVVALGRSVETRNDYQRRLNALCQWAVRDRRLASNPLMRMQMMRVLERRRSKRHLTPEELSALIAVAPAERAVYYRIAARTGLRWSEIRALKWSNIDLAAGWIRLEAANTKAKRADELPITDDLAGALVELRGDGPEDAPLFATKPTRITFRKDCVRAGIARPEELSPQALRRTLGTYLAQAGVAPQVAQKLMRHSDINLTLRNYTNLKLLDLRGAAARMPAIVDKPVEAKPAAKTA